MSMTANDTLPLTKVDGVVPGAHDVQRVMGNVGPDFVQGQPVCLIISCPRELEAVDQENG